MDYIIGSHNSWSFLPPRKWWLKPFAFIAKCQNKNIFKQLSVYNVKCFDLRARFNKKGEIVISHGFMEYKYSKEELFHDLTLLNNNECLLRILHEVRIKKQYTKESTEKFIALCEEIQAKFPKIKLWCGRNLYNWSVDYDFPYKPSCEEKYSSVCKPRYIDDWFPWVYAKLNNKKNLKKGTTSDILLIDYVNIR